VKAVRLQEARSYWHRQLSASVQKQAFGTELQSSWTFFMASPGVKCEVPHDSAQSQQVCHSVQKQGL
jgi:hypothetical protein